MKYYKTHTLGCKVNTYETQAIKELLNKNGYEESLEDNPLCDVYIINTCAVTSIGEQESRQKIRSAIKKYPGIFNFGYLYSLSLCCFQHFKKFKILYFFIDKYPFTFRILMCSDKKRHLL